MKKFLPPWRHLVGRLPAAVLATPRRGELPLRRRLLRVVVVVWGLAIAAGSAGRGHSALTLIAFEIPVLAAVGPTFLPRFDGRIGAGVLAVALVAMGTSSSLLLNDPTASLGVLSIALVLACWLEDRLATTAAAICILIAETGLSALSPQSGAGTAERLFILAGIIGAAVGPWRFNAAREDELSRDRQALEGLVQVARSVSSSEDPRRALVQGVLSFARADLVSLCQLSADGQHLEVTRSSDPKLEQMTFPVHSRPSGIAAALNAQRTLLIRDAADHPLVDRELIARHGLQSLLYEIIWDAAAPIGVLAVGWQTKLTGHTGHLQGLVALAAGEATTAIRQDQATAILRRQATSDPLTGAANRRVFDERLPAALEQARVTGMPLALAAMDLNGFKQLNDTEGHDAGDHVLRRCVEIWQAELRPGDLLVRLGGDEFAAVLPNCGPGDVQAVASRLKDALYTHLRVSTGIGIAVWDRSETAAQLTRRADRLLYTDKRRGSRPAHASSTSTTLLDLPPDPQLFHVTDALAAATGAPVALLSLTTGDQQYPIAHTGLADHGTPVAALDLTRSYCHYPATCGRELIIPDAHAHPAFAEHPTTIELGARSYAGIPVTDQHDQIIGVACVIDVHARQWKPEDLAALRMAATVFANHLSSTANA